jgi:predicted HTH transcriptional regulator
MNRKELLELIEGGESITCEFKRKFSSYKKIAREIIAFANTKGGLLIFGVDDDKKIIGVESEKEIAELINDTIKNYCEPQIDIRIHYKNLSGKEVVVIEVPESDNKPHRLQDYQDKPAYRTGRLDINNAIVTIRVNDKSIQASKEMVRIMRANSNGLQLKNYSIGSNEKSVFEYLDDNETISVKELSKLVNISERRASRTLVKLVRANLLMIHTKDNGEEFFTGI